MMIFTLNSCDEQNPKKIFINVLTYAQRNQKEKILEMTRPNHWVGDYKSDGSIMNPEETVDLLIKVMKDRDLKYKDDISVSFVDDEMVILDYTDQRVVNNVQLGSIMMGLAKIEKKYFIVTIEISCGECNGWK